MSVQIPRLTSTRRRFRRFCILLIRLLFRLLVKRTVTGTEHLPQQDPYIVAGNHLWGLDPALVMSELVTPPEVLGARKILHWPVIGPFARGYGMIPVESGTAGRNALNVAVEVLKQGRTLMIFPEGRESRSGGLERGRSGITYIAHLSGVTTVIPVAITGTETALSSWKRLRRPIITVTFGQAIDMPSINTRQTDAEMGLQLVMTSIARMLPEHYRGVYQDAV